MKRRSFKMAALLMGLMLVLPLLSCGALAEADKEPVTISMMMMQTWLKEPMKDLFAQIEAEENITIDLQVIPDEQLAALTKAKMAAGEVPDIITAITPQWTGYGWDNLADLSAEPWVERLYSVTDSMKNPDGQLVVFPNQAYTSVMGVFYNKKAFADAGITDTPKNYDEFLATMETLKTHGKATPLFQAGKEDWCAQMFVAFAVGQALSPDIKATAEKIYTNQLKVQDVPEFGKVIDDFIDLFRNGYVNADHITATYEDAKDNLANGTAAMFINGDWFVSDIRAKHGDKVNDIGFFPLPYAGNGLVITNIDQGGMLLYAKSKNLEAAKRWLNAWSQPKYQDAFFAMNPQPLASCSDTNGGEVEPLVAEIAPLILVPDGVTYQLNAFMPEASSAFWDGCLKDIIAATTLNGKPTDQIVADYQKKIEEVMKAKEMPGW